MKALMHLHGSSHTAKGHLLYTCAPDIVKCLSSARILTTAPSKPPPLHTGSWCPLVSPKDVGQLAFPDTSGIFGAVTQCPTQKFGLAGADVVGTRVDGFEFLRVCHWCVSLFYLCTIPMSTRTMLKESNPNATVWSIFGINVIDSIHPLDFRGFVGLVSSEVQLDWHAKSPS